MTENSLYGLNRDVVEKIRSLFAKHPEIESVIVYGSRATGKFKPGSDIDLTMTGERVDFTLRLKIEAELDDLLLPYKIDLSCLSEIENADLKAHIARVGKIFYLRS